MKEIRIKLKKEEYNYLLEILKNEEDVIKLDRKQGNIDGDDASLKLQWLLRIKHAVGFLDREK